MEKSTSLCALSGTQVEVCASANWPERARRPVKIVKRFIVSSFVEGGGPLELRHVAGILLTRENGDTSTATPGTRLQYETRQGVYLLQQIYPLLISVYGKAGP